MAPAGGGNIKVVVRVRPFNNRELDRHAKCVVQMKESQTILIPPPDAEERLRNSKGGKVDGQKVFAFDRSYWSFDKNDPHFAGQDNLHADLGKPLLDNAFQGYNNCIFAYGQTGSGKSYSMMGYGAEAGVIPRICQDMFERITEQQKDANLSCTVEVSYLEIYNERVRDLLNPATKGNLKVREHPSTGPYVEDLAKLVVRSFTEIEHLMDEGNKARTVAATNMNETSSRSHAVFTLTLTQKRHDVETRMDTEKVAKISLVDLAGSERATSTGATGARLKEGAEINRSLSTLGRVIAALADLSSGKKRNMSMVPYRDSVLTWLLKDSLGGNSMTAMIAAISPADINFEETLSTLRYADSAKRIKNHAVVNEDPNARMIRELKEELAQLRSKLSGGGSVEGIPGEVYAEGTPLEKQFVTITNADGSVKKVSKAEIAEQLNQSEKLYQDLNQTWEQKLQKTEQIHKEREAALEELGISIEKGFVGLHTPKKMPHLVNLSDDPLLAECLVYNLKPGTTTVGNVETATTSEIRLNGSRILHDHCTFMNTDGVVTVVPNEGAAVMVNGLRIDEPKRLRSGYRVILGDFHIFRFNNPQEARAERAETQSSLRHSVLASNSGSPGPRLSNGFGHERSHSRALSDFEGSSRPDSPAPMNKNSRDTDWSMARREAASALLGPDQKIAQLTDDELDNLFEDVQRVRAGRRGRPESRHGEEDDTDSMTSYPVREKYASTGTIDNFSLDTALTMPSTPQYGEVDERLRLVREDMQNQLEKQKEDYQEKLKAAEASNVEIDLIRAEKEKMEESLRAAKEEMQAQLQLQKEEFETRIREISESPKKNPGDGLTEGEIKLASSVIEHWRQRRYVRMAEAILQHAATLKQAQVMSQEMDKDVVFQFALVDVGHTFASSYDLVLNGISGEDDEMLDSAPKPCVAVRVIDYKNSVIHLWSLEKLQVRVRQMRQMHQYLDRPEYLQHLLPSSPFSEACMPQFSLIGDADIPLTAVFESRVQDFSLDVISPYTCSVIGIVKLSLEPSSAQAPSSTLKFNVVMHDMVGFAEREGTDVHAQLFIPGISDEGGATTTQMISQFDEGPVKFESVHSMSLPQTGSRGASLRVSIFAKVTSMHLDKLLSWDSIRDAPQPPKHRRKSARIAEREFYTEERHDVFTRVQIQELSETGEYLPVEVLQHHELDPGCYQLHQGLQRRIVVNITHSSGETLEWADVSSLRVGHIQLVDPSNKAQDLGTPSPEIPLKLLSQPTIHQNANGTCNATLTGQWDSSLHDSLLLDRTTAPNYRIRFSLLWTATSPRLAAPMTFSLHLTAQIQPRAHTRSALSSPYRLLTLFTPQPTRSLRSTVSTFSLAIRPTSAKRAVDLWRMNTSYDYVKGEDLLTNWAPRGVSLVRDYIAQRRRRRRVAEIETARGVLSSRALRPSNNAATASTTASSPAPELDQRQQDLLRKFLGLWAARKDPGEVILVSANTEPPTNGLIPHRAPSTSVPSTAPTSSSPNAEPTPAPRLVAEVRLIPKNPNLLKGGYLLSPNEAHTRWVRRYVELRRPYLHVHAVPGGEEVLVVNLTNARVDHSPDIKLLLVAAGGGGSSGGSSTGVERTGGANAGGHAGATGSHGGGGGVRENVLAIYAERNTWLFAARSEREKVEWILKIDQSYFSSGRSSASVSGRSGSSESGEGSGLD
ncbi:MAG: kinesin-like protein Klp8 [Vezdaea acicularis]|nr:MAG: kinesin-like protein Klp8 [Vezdaea acicularis]